MASYYNSAGSKVTIIEMQDQIAGEVDTQIANILMKNYQKNGITFQLNSKVTEILSDGVTYEYNGKRETIKADKVLMSVGRKPAVNGFGLENLGVELEHGAIKTDEYGKNKHS